MRRRRLLIVVSLCSALLIIAGSSIGFAVRVAHAQHRAAVTRGVTSNAIGSPSCSRWAAYPGPNDGSNSSVFYAVTAVPNSTQVWAVGADLNGTTGVQDALIERYDGAHWSVVPSPNVASQNVYLMGIVAVSTSDVWAVGYGVPVGTTTTQTLIEQWNGATWSVVPSPNVAQTVNSLYAITAVSANDIWAVGTYFSNTASLWQTLIEQWNGSVWSIVQSPNGSVAGPKSGLPGNNTLAGVAAVSASDIWAVGNDSNHTLTEHWNGTSWSLVASPNGASGTGALVAVAATSATHVMAVGSASSSGGNSTLAELWNGTSWSAVASPNLGTTNSDTLNAIVVIPGTSEFIAAGTAEAFGAIANGSTSRLRGHNRPYSSIATFKTLVEQWNGTVWSIVPTPNLSSLTNGLNGIATTSLQHIWAVGTYQQSATSDQTLIEQYVPNAMGISCSQ